MRHLLLALLVGVLAGALRAQDDLDALRASVEAAELSDAEQEALATELSAADGLLARAAELAADADRYRELTEKAPDDLLRVQDELDAPAPPEPGPAPADHEVADFETEQRLAEAGLEEARARVTELIAEAAGRQERRRVVPELLARLETEEQELREELEGTLPEELSGRVTRTVREARLAATVAEHDALEAELRSYDARKDLLPRRQTRWERQVTLRQRDLEVWTARLATARDEEAQAARDRANELAMEEAAQIASVSAVIDETQDFIERSEAYTRRAEIARLEREKTRVAFEDLEKQASEIREKLELIGLTNDMGRILRDQRAKLERRGHMSAERARLREDWAEAELERLDLAGEKRELDQESRITQLVERVSQKADALDMDALRAVVREAVEENTQRRRALLDAVRELGRIRFEHLQVHDGFAEATEEQRRIIEELVLYVGSVEGSKIPDPRRAREAIVWLVSDPAWGRKFGLIWRGLESRPRDGVLFLLGLLLLALRPRTLRALRDCGERVRRYRTDRIGLTGLGFLATAVLALPKPLLMGAVGSALAASGDPKSAPVVLGGALVRMAWFYLPIYALRALARKGGLAEAHLRWPTAGCRVIRRALLWFIPFTLPCILLAAVFRGAEVREFDDSLGRPATWLAFVALATVSRRHLGREGPLLGPWLKRSTGVIARSHRLWYALAVLAPLVLIVASALGYHYTSIQFGTAYRRSLALVLVLVVGRGILTRWRNFTRRRLAVEQARARVHARGHENESAGETTALDEDAVDIPAVDAQTRRVFDSLVFVGLVVGLYLIWASLLPALSVLDRLQVLPEFEFIRSELVDDVPVSASPIGSAESTPSLPVPGRGVIQPATEPAAGGGVPSRITVADILTAILLLAATGLLTRNVPGLLEFAVLVRLPLDAGARYAVTSLVRYVIVLIGLTASMGAVGIGWTNVQWLAAALTFGLAFGLQEIFANFVSGIILLIERPLRVGDYVTVDGIEGQVTRLRIRATTITDWDNRELLVPNKQFITTSLVNWTLSDTVTRFVVPVGVAYGSDVRRAEEVLLEVAHDAENVLEQPRPTVVFREFGDSSLLLQLRVFLPHRDVWPGVASALHYAIDDAFRAAGIEIAFPQRDLHLRSIDPAAARHFRQVDPDVTEPR